MIISPLNMASTSPLASRTLVSHSFLSSVSPTSKELDADCWSLACSPISTSRASMRVSVSSSAVAVRASVFEMRSCSFSSAASSVFSKSSSRSWTWCLSSAISATALSTVVTMAAMPRSASSSFLSTRSCSVYTCSRRSRIVSACASSASCSPRAASSASSIFFPCSRTSWCSASIRAALSACNRTIDSSRSATVSSRCCTCDCIASAFSAARRASSLHSAVVSSTARSARTRYCRFSSSSTRRASASITSMASAPFSPPPRPIGRPPRCGRRRRAVFNQAILSSSLLVPTRRGSERPVLIQIAI